MRRPKQLLENEDRLVTRMGAWFPGERVVFRGKDLFNELSHQRWMGLLLYGITGRLFTDKQIQLFEGIWTLSTSYPDPRLWNNRVAALAGTARSTGALGIGAAVAVSEATIYGGRPVLGAIDFLLRAQKHLDKGFELADFVNQQLQQNRLIAGYGRPIIGIDERIEPLTEFAAQLGFRDGPYVELAFQVEEILLKNRFRLHMNVAALAAALAADQGLSEQEYYQYSVLCFTAGMFPCFINERNEPEGTFLPLSCRRVSYNGPPRRSWDESADVNDRHKE